MFFNIATHVSHSRRKGENMSQEGRAFYEKLIGNVSKVIVGKEETMTLLSIALIAGGHVLLEDVPGTGKTKMAKALAKSLDLE